jgi:hypothetical protein
MTLSDRLRSRLGPKAAALFRIKLSRRVLGRVAVTAFAVGAALALAAGLAAASGP